MQCKFKMVVYVLFLLTISLTAQTHELFNKTEKNNLFLGIWKDLKNSTDNAFSNENHNFIKIATFTGLTSLFILSTDLELYEEYGLEKETSPIGIPKIMGNIGKLYDKPGPLYFSLGFAGTLYGAGRILNNQKLLETTNLMARAFIVSGLLTSALKIIIGRARPYKNNDPGSYKPFNFKLNSNYMSMPSGHTSSIFAMMTVLAKQYDEWYVKIPAYGFAASVAVQRMNSSNHWSSDLLVGATIGYIAGSTVVRKHHSARELSIQPVFSFNSVGLAFQF